VSNSPARLASLDQGKSLLRVAKEWVVGDDGSDRMYRRFLVHAMNDAVSSGSSTPTSSHRNGIGANTIVPCGHVSTVFGTVGALLGLDDADQVCELLGYCAARDAVSAAVRLNLVGPLASVRVLADAHKAARLGIVEAMRKKDPTMEDDEDDELTVASCAPLLDCIHPCHDLLAVRLFRT